MHNIQFEYRSTVEELIMPEYGRNVQDLVRHCKEIEDPRYRQSFAESIVDLMQIMTPYNKNLDEHRKKLWHHFFRIAKYDIEVIPPAGVNPNKEDDMLRPAKVIYPPNNERFRHYGNYVNSLITKALELDDEVKQKEFAMLIGSFMKMAFRTWNKDHHITDEIVKKDLATMSKGKLILDPDVVLDTQNSNSHRTQKRPPILTKNKNNQKNKNKNKMKKSNSNMHQKRY